MAGFKFRKSLQGSQDVAELEIIGANSIVFQIGDLIRINTSGFAALATTGDLILGVVTGVVDKNRATIDPDAASTPDIFTMASDNQTVAQKRVRYIPALQDYLFQGTLDGALAQTNLMQYVGIDDENNPDSASVAPSDATVNTLRLVELDPDGVADLTIGLFQIVESFWAQNCMGTVDTGGIEA